MANSGRIDTIQANVFRTKNASQFSRLCVMHAMQIETTMCACLPRVHCQLQAAQSQLPQRCCYLQGIDAGFAISRMSAKVLSHFAKGACVAKQPAPAYIGFRHSYCTSFAYSLLLLKPYHNLPYTQTFSCYELLGLQEKLVHRIRVTWGP